MMNLTSFIKDIKTQFWLKSNKDFWSIKLPFRTFQEIDANERDIFLQKLNKENTLLKKECGVNFLYLSKGIATILVENNFIHIPVLLINIEKDVINQIISFDELAKEYPQFINPLLVNYLENHFSHETIHQLGTTIFELDEKIVKFDWEATDLGIYNLFKHFPALSDLDSIEYEKKLSATLLKMMGNESSELKQEVKKRFLFEADDDQIKIFDQLPVSSLIIQGPPGTGKTQTLANITGSYLAENKTVLVVSEKKAALDVLQTRLKERKLDVFCLNSTNRFNEKYIFNDLKETWLFFEKSIASELPPNYKKNKFPLIELWFGEHQNEVKEIVVELKKLEQSATKIYLPFTTSEWKKHTHFLLDKNNSFYRAVSFLKPTFFDQNTSIQDTLFQLNEAVNLIKKSSISTKLELENTIRKCTDFILYKSVTFKKYGHLIGKKQSKFLSIRKKWNQLQNKKSLFEETHLSHWIKIPSKSELDYLIQLYNNDGFFAGRKWKNEWKNWVRTLDLNPEDLFQKLAIYYDLLQQNSVLIDKLSELNIESSSEIETVFHFLSTVNEENYLSFTQTENQNVDELIAYQSEFMQLNRLVNNWFDIKNEERLDTVIELIKCEILQIHSAKKELKTLPNDIIVQLKHFDSFSALNTAFLLGRWSELTRFNVHLEQFSDSELLQELIDFQTEKENGWQAFADDIICLHLHKFQAYHLLLKTENRKLNAEQKSLKETLKKGKSILVKEFSKQRNHLTLRQLMESEASSWIFLLKPIWLTNPTTISLSFPMKRELFDIVLFDEAGRIPLSNALGALQRSKKCVVAGDSQQMAPSNYFQQEHSEENYSLLHQATFYLDNVLLRQHYRSYYPELISFSNEHFYNNELSVFPSAFRPETAILKFHHIENGKYVDRNNFVEALQLATFYFSLSDTVKASNKIGIVAFSESQLQCIWNCFSDQQQNEILKSIDADRLFFKTLEQVQGDECDILLISFGYGKNEHGNFEMRFGPINQLHGDKRLNVLFSRARKSIQFFASVRATDFPITENPSVRTLWHWFLYLENYNNERNDDNKLEFISFINGFNSKEEASRMTKLYQQRGWKFRV